MIELKSLRQFGLCVGLLLATALPAPAENAPKTAPAEAPSDAVKPTDAEQAAAAPAPWVEELTTRARKSIVVISFLGRDGRQLGLGTGFVVSPDGLIATNLHVIGEARPISVKSADGKQYEVKEIYATERSLDLAILKVAPNDLPPLELADSDTLRQGQTVVAIGNPQGLQYSVVSGLVSGRREIDGKPMIQLAIPVEAGNSGGPLIDRQGRVHGILTLKSAVTANLGFAVAINALKPLLEKPNPIPISKWLTIGLLDPKEWKTLFGANWKQRAGRILVDGPGQGFGGRSLSLATAKPPDAPYELAVWVKLAAEDGAAGLVFHCEGDDRHYGFYPSNGRLRLSRFDGPDVYSWHVLKEVASRAYRRGEWNRLKVSMQKDNVRCFVNDELVIESDDNKYAVGAVGLAKFRDTQAEFKDFKIGKSITDSKPSAEFAARIAKLVETIPADVPPKAELIDKAAAEGDQAVTVLRERAHLLEQQARRVEQLAAELHQKKVRDEITEMLKKKDDEISLLHAALLISSLDNADLDVAAYLRQADRMADELDDTFAKNADEKAKLAALNKYLFEDLGFHGSRTEYYSRSNSYLNEVIDDREGLPITLSVLYMELAKHIGLNVVGVGLPGHFIVRFEPKEGEGVLLDPFERGKTLTRDEADAVVRSFTGQPLEDEHLVTQTKKQILNRMLANLMRIAQERQDGAGMLRYTEAMLAIDSDSPQYHWVRAVLRYQTERIDEAIADTEWLLSREPAEIDMNMVRQLRATLDEAKSPPAAPSEKQ
ncbi:MAG: transglutaminase family protein [Planctomycetaceae bacterium]